MNRPSLLPHFLASSVVASVVAGLLFLVHPGAAEDQQSRGQWRFHESLAVLIGGTLAGGAVSGAIAAWLLLKINTDTIEEFNKLVKSERFNEELKEFNKLVKSGKFDKLVRLDANLQDKISKKINELQSSIDELKDFTS